jgi:hypothetical protein
MIYGVKHLLRATSNAVVLSVEGVQLAREIEDFEELQTFCGICTLPETQLLVRLILEMRTNRQLRCCCPCDVEQACPVMR